VSIFELIKQMIDSVTNHFIRQCRNAETKEHDMKTFILLLTMWNSDGSAPSVDVLDYGMSGEDCVTAMIELTEVNGFDIETIKIMGGTLSCEFDLAGNGELG
jgi:hypothetical protein